MQNWIVVAVDGEAASGKGTISKRLAEQLNLRYLDTGKLYRTLAYYLNKHGGQALHEDERKSFFDYLDHSRPSDNELQSDFISMQSSKIAGEKWARAMLIEYQRSFANDTVDGYEGSVLDGRDIGSVVCPDAEIKIFVTARIQIRAERRLRQLLENGEKAQYDRVLENLIKRDKSDKNREHSPLIVPDDAFVIDTSQIKIQDAVSAAVAHVNTQRYG